MTRQTKYTSSSVASRVGCNGRLFKKFTPSSGGIGETIRLKPLIVFFDLSTTTSRSLEILGILKELNLNLISYMGNLPEGAQEVVGTSGVFIKLAKPGDFVTGTLSKREVREDKFNPGKEQTIYSISDVEAIESHRSQQNPENGLWEPSETQDEVPLGETAIVTGKGDLNKLLKEVEIGERVHIESLGKKLVTNRKTGAKIFQGQYKVYRLPPKEAGSDLPF